MARESARKKAHGFSSERTEWILFRIVAPAILSAFLFLGVLVRAGLV